jgi:hypothetical protein
MLVLAVLALGGIALFTASGGLGRALATIGNSLSGVLDDLSATPSPTASPPLLIGAPLLTAPEEPYTNEPTVDLVITVPSEAMGQPNTTVRIYLALGNQAPVAVDEVAVPTLRPQLVVPVELTKGSNTFTVAIVGPGGDESDPSASVRYILDQEKPKVTLASPRDGATVNGRAVTLVGKTQPRSELVAHNEANNRSVPGTAAADGTFTLALPIAGGVNGITITATDPAGNVGKLVLAVRRGSGRLTAVLGSSVYRISRDRLPEPVELAVVVNDPDGTPLEGARVTFTLSIPGIQTITAEAVTAGDGRATFQTTIPKGAMIGQGIATVLVHTDAFGDTSDQTTVTITR